MNFIFGHNDQPNKMNLAEATIHSVNTESEMKTNKTRKEPVRLEKLPMKVLFRICLHLDLKDICTLCETCKVFKTIGNEALNYKRKYTLRSTNNGLVSKKWEQRLIYTALQMMEPRKILLYKLGACQISLLDVLLAVQRKLMLENTENIIMLESEKIVDLDDQEEEEGEEEEGEEEEKGEDSKTQEMQCSIGDISALDIKEEIEQIIEEKKKESNIINNAEAGEDIANISGNVSFIKSLKLNDFDLSKGSGDIFMNTTKEFNDSNDHSTLLNSSGNNINVLTHLKEDKIYKTDTFENDGKPIDSSNDLLSEEPILPIISPPLSSILTTNRSISNGVQDRKVQETIDDDTNSAQTEQIPVSDDQYEKLEEDIFSKVIEGFDKILADSVKPSLTPSLSSTSTISSSTKAKIAMFENASKENGLLSYSTSNSVVNRSNPHNNISKKLESYSPKKTTSGQSDINVEITKMKDLDYEYDISFQKSEEKDMDKSFELIRQLQNSTRVKDKKILFETLVEKTHELSKRRKNQPKLLKTKNFTKSLSSSREQSIADDKQETVQFVDISNKETEEGEADGDIPETIDVTTTFEETSTIDPSFMSDTTTSMAVASATATHAPTENECY